MAGRMTWLCRADGFGVVSSGDGNGETRNESAVVRVEDVMVARRVCSVMKDGMLRRPRRVSERQFRRVFSSKGEVFVLA